MNGSASVPARKSPVWFPNPDSRPFVAQTTHIWGKQFPENNFNFGLVMFIHVGTSSTT
jgi:hypothetical protein